MLGRLFMSGDTADFTADVIAARGVADDRVV